MKPILIDSGPLIALFNRSDKYHSVSVEFIKKNKRLLVTSVANITEVVYVLDFSREAQTAFLRWISLSSIKIEKIESEEIEQLCDLFEKYHDVPMDFADACMVYLGDKLSTNEIATIDSDFEIYRLKGRKPFKNVIK
jgi:predicted nucleic acid-binding protein